MRRVALLWISCLLGLIISPVTARNSVGAAVPDEPSEKIHLRSRYFAAGRQQKPPRDVLVTHTRTRQSADGTENVEVLSTEKLVQIGGEVDDDLVEAIAAERKLQMTIAEGVKRVYKVPNKNYNNKKKSSSSSSRKKGSSSSKSKSKKSRDSESSKKKKKKKKSTKRSRSSTVIHDKKKRKSRSQRKRKKSLFKKESTSKTKDSKSKKKSTKRTKDSTSKSKSGDQTCKSKDEIECRDDCIESNCGFTNDKMCVRKCKQDCCASQRTSDDNETGDSDDDMDGPTAAPVANGGGGPAPEPTTLQPAAPVSITPAPTVALPLPRSCPTDVNSLTSPGSLGCSPGGCCIIASDSMQDVCNFQALSTAGVASIENGQIFVEEIDTSANGPLPIQAGCDISCTSQCRLSAIAQQIPDAPADLTTYAGPGTISCNDGYCETADASGCNSEGFDAVGNVGTDDAGKTVAWSIESSAAPVAIEGGCLIDCSESRCAFGRASF